MALHVHTQQTSRKVRTIYYNELNKNTKKHERNNEESVKYFVIMSTNVSNLNTCLNKVSNKFDVQMNLLKSIKISDDEITKEKVSLITFN